MILPEILHVYLIEFNFIQVVLPHLVIKAVLVLRYIKHMKALCVNLVLD